MNAFKRDKKEEEEGTYQTYGIYQWRCFWKFKFEECRKFHLLQKMSAFTYVLLEFDAT